MVSSKVTYAPPPPPNPCPEQKLSEGLQHQCARWWECGCKNNFSPKEQSQGSHKGGDRHSHEGVGGDRNHPLLLVLKGITKKYDCTRRGLSPPNPRRGRRRMHEGWRCGKRCQATDGPPPNQSESSIMPRHTATPGGTRELKSCHLTQKNRLCWYGGGGLKTEEMGKRG